MTNKAGENPKIIIDEDWKTQVEREKQEAASKQESAEPENTEAGYGPMPPATLPVLITTLATQALMALGQMPNPMTGKAEHQPETAKHMIDLIQMLQEKTAGNRTPEETQMIDEVLHQLRLAFVTGGVSAPPGGTPPTA